MLCSGVELGLNEDLYPGAGYNGLLVLPEAVSYTHLQKPNQMVWIMLAITVVCVVIVFAIVMAQKEKGALVKQAKAVTKDMVRCV